ncbi:MAG: FdhD/NarQ family, partial [Subtercola sp.]|nr:FdhD/NarQ family [Subtercola sp.]
VEMGITLVGFLRGSSMNVYSCTERVDDGFSTDSVERAPALAPRAQDERAAPEPLQKVTTR